MPMTRFYACSLVLVVPIWNSQMDRRAAGVCGVHVNDKVNDKVRFVQLLLYFEALRCTKEDDMRLQSAYHFRRWKSKSRADPKPPRPWKSLTLYCPCSQLRSIESRIRLPPPLFRDVTYSFKSLARHGRTAAVSKKKECFWPHASSLSQ